tara:strand:+ start:503 stop:1654 length:1152 start_codon:yes stop_codon:yes gene_type:complete
MSNKKDLISLGEAYADVFNKVVVSENVPVGEIGNADLVTKDTGPTERGGFRPAKIDIDRMSEKDKKDNIYNIKGYTYGDGNNPGDTDSPDPTGPTYAQVAYTGAVGPEEDEEEKGKRPDYPDVDDDGDTDESMEKALKDKKKGKNHDDDEEDEEFLEEHEKIARDGLNNFMSKTSVFDKLYNKVMVNENFPHEGQEEFEDVTELEALGIEDTVEEVPEEITVSIPGELAQTLCDILQTALAQQEVEVDVDVDVEAVEDTDFEEDAETARQKTYGGNKGDHPRRFNKKTGRKSEVRDYEEDEEAVMKDGGGYGVDAGSTLKHEVNYGRGGRNKVGNLKPVAGGPKMKDGGGYGVDAGSTHTKEVNYGKNNKVGTLKVGKNAFEQ